ncbi:SagB family peptide dehydrogenase [Ectobacillus polymachus]|uniref:SagB family peptide dehydrogenase n=1 Tax=Ectobacillus polymachus TaxID=1508806 RepID=UPI003A87DDA4
MNLDTFLYNLHFEPDKISPPDWQVDWEDAPLSYKLYRGLPEIPLSTEVPLFIEEREGAVKPSLKGIGHLLWYIYGLTQYSQTAFSNGITENDVMIAQSLRRFVPSGGAMYPNELYVYLKLDDIPEGIYHYSVAHHRLVMLREGNYDSYLSRSLGNNCDISDCFGTLFISTMFWKNFYKYNNFSYRLQGLDAGVLIGQTLEVANRLGFSTRICYQFLDRPINHLLGLSEQNESVYAVIPLSIQPVNNFGESDKLERVCASALCQELPVLIHESFQRSKRVLDYPMIRKINEASMVESTDAFVKMEQDNQMSVSSSMETVMLPFTEPLSYDLAAVCRKRYSINEDFLIGKVSQVQLATLLKETFSFSYQNDLDKAEGNIESRLDLFSCFYHVDDIPNGAYSYDKRMNALHRISPGDYREYLQYGLTLDNVNLFQVPLGFHVVGDKNHLIEKLGYRGYRIQQMEAGILVQRLLLAANALGMGGHPLLGFDAKSCDELYQIESKGKTSLIHIPIGHYRPRAWLKGSLHS